MICCNHEKNNQMPFLTLTFMSVFVKQTNNKSEKLNLETSILLQEVS